MNALLKFLQTWLGRIAFGAAGVILIITSVTAHGPKEAAGIVTGLACIVFAIYATIRGLSGDVRVSRTQFVGLIDLGTWYDFVVAGVLALISIIAWII
jgi:hypothetical protein